MEKLTFNTIINAPRHKVWEILWGEHTYPAWTAPFAEGSKIVTDWQVGGRTLFLDSKNDGMVSTIAAKIPDEYMSFKHLGDIRDGVEDLTSDRVKAWAGTTENYTLSERDGKTALLVEMDADADFKSYFESAFPKALSVVKELAEQ
ncbi:MAG: SRPBCC domain-containing protein [Chitinophaga sp.]|uniref:SRPBCC family protein n=1 Tax=Chitinophaga sp. TaxID=1869181 RepID=UPI001AFE0918|nr:SRPBCC domain-containing protein [Chitinophaga sp.]MBO9728748.1 SRPBCC domain-containing protein [Chitinophaga sp.]